MDDNVDAAVVEAVAQLVRNLGGDLTLPGGPVRTPARIEEKALGGSGEWQPDVVQPVIVQFKSEPPGAVVTVDGKLVCQDTSRGCSRMIAPGTHSVSMQKEGYAERTEKVSVTERTTLSWELSSSFGSLEVRSKPPGLEVSLNGKQVGQTPYVDEHLSAGAYQVMVVGENYYDAGKQIQLEVGEKEVVELELKLVVGALSLTAVDGAGNALEAEVKVDGEVVGRTPLTHKAVVGPHEVVVAVDGVEWRERVEVLEKRVVAREAELHLKATGDKRTPAAVSGATVATGKKGEPAPEEPRFRLGLGACEGVTLYERSPYRTNVSPELDAGFRLIESLDLWLDVAWQGALESPYLQTLQGGARYHLGGLYLRVGGFFSINADIAFTGGYLGAGYLLELYRGLGLTGEVDALFMPAPVFPVYGKLGLAYRF